MRKLLISVAVGLAVIAGLEFLLYKQLSAFTRSGRTTEDNDPNDLLLPANEISFSSDDGADLHGWLIHGKAGFPALIIAHDYGSNRSMTLVKLETLITSLNKQGYFIFLFDFRGHGMSQFRSSLGYNEGRDVSAAVKAVLKYKQIHPRIAVLGIGMGAIATSQAVHSVDEVKFLILDSIYEDIPSKYSKIIITEWPFLTLSEPVLAKAIDWNLQQMLKLPSTRLALSKKMPGLYPKPVLFVEKAPLRADVRALYQATREPKEILQMQETASGELIGEQREAYAREVGDKIRKYLPAVSNQKTIELP